MTHWKASVTQLSHILALFSFLVNLSHPLTMSATRLSPLMKHRIELFFKHPTELKERIRFLHAHGFTAFNLVNKHQKDTIEDWVQCILQEMPDADVCAHYSLKYNKVARKGVEEHQAKLIDFLSNTRAHQVLIISGSGNKTAWNTVPALSTKTSHHAAGLATIAVAYNPYFPHPQDQAAEDQRLQQKLKSNMVSKVYIQFGTDLDRLKAALEDLQAYPVALAGSIFLPTRQLIAQQKFRPWNGVFLSPEFLSGPDQAQAIVLAMLKLYRRYNVELLWEAPGIRSEKDLQVLQNLVQQVEESSDIYTNHDSTQHEANDSHPTNQQARAGDGTDDMRGGTSSPSKRPKLNGNSNSRSGTAVVLFGSHDVRLLDNLALDQALRKHERVLPLFLWRPQGPWGVRGALQVILQEALLSLESSLATYGLPLVCRNCEGDGAIALVEVAQACGACTVYWNREHTTESRELEKQRKSALQQKSIAAEECQSSLLYDPDLIELESGFHGGHWGTLMPFLKSCNKKFGEPRRPISCDETIQMLHYTKRPDQIPSGVSIKDLKMADITGKERWDVPIRERFPMNEASARQALDVFFQNGLSRYESERSRADKEHATSRLSPHLRIGTLSPNELYWRTADSGLKYEALKTFSRRLFWRDLAYFQLRCFPDMRNVPIRKHYQMMEWVTGEEEKRRLEAWKWGKTGFPIVDAGMRELYATGWIMQSIRMVVASFLVEYLRINWVKGCEWFHYTLADADSAINAMMWNNAGKSGIDQWNFVLSPVTASQDPTGDYVRKWVPELARLPTAALVHRPWEASPDILKGASVALGETYPHRIVADLKAERAKSVNTTLQMRRKSQDANTDRGYDLIQLPNGKETVVFTKKEYRIDRDGFILEQTTERKPGKLTKNNLRQAGAKKSKKIKAAKVAGS